MPKGVRHCPAACAISYRLVFGVRGEKGMGVPGRVALDVHPTGYQPAKGLGVVRTTSFCAGFYRLLGNAMGLRNAGYQTFAGALRTGD